MTFTFRATFGINLSGTVNFSTGGHAKTGRFPLALRGDAQFGVAPGNHRPGTKPSIVRCRHGVAGKVVEVGDPIVDGDEPLEVSGGSEPRHDPLLPPRRKVRILCPVVKGLVLAMLEIHAHPGSGSAAGTELVGDHHARCVGLLADELAQELLRRAPTLTTMTMRLLYHRSTPIPARRPSAWGYGPAQRRAGCRQIAALAVSAGRSSGRMVREPAGRRRSVHDRPAPVPLLAGPVLIRTSRLDLLADGRLDLLRNRCPDGDARHCADLVTLCVSRRAPGADDQEGRRARESTGVPFYPPISESAIGR
jgi:hypothetical protein